MYTTSSKWGSVTLLKLWICLYTISRTHITFVLSRHVVSREVQDLTRTQVQAYLRQYGYLQDYDMNSQTPATEKDFTEALMRFQNFIRIELTGKIDQETMLWMRKLRCGCHDLPMRKKMMIRTRRFAPEQFRTRSKWNKNTITWKITKYRSRLDDNDVRREMYRAFEAWSDVSGLTFSEVSSQSQSDMTISFEPRDHGDGSPFDGNGNVLAHAFYPSDGRTHFDDDEEWVINENGVDLFTVATHELGHALGLAHSRNANALMAPFYTGYDPNFRLHSDDIAGIQSLYGPPAGMPPPPSTTERTTMTPPVSTTLKSIPSLPEICNVRFDAVMRDDNGDILAFVRDRQVIRMTERDGMVEMKKAVDIFPNAPEDPDGVVNLPTDGVYFFRRLMMWKYRQGTGVEAGRNLVSMDYMRDGRILIPEQIRAVFGYSGNEVIMIGTGLMWSFDAANFRAKSGSYEYVDRMFPGLPRAIDAAMAKDYDSVYFFKGTQYWMHSRITRRLTGPRDIAPAFIKGQCGNERKL